MNKLILTDENFQNEVLESGVPVLVDFWAPWCGPCQMMNPIMEELANEYDASKTKIAKLNVDDYKDTAMKYKVMSVPTFKLFKNGEVVDELVGGVTKEKLKEMIESST